MIGYDYPILGVFWSMLMFFLFFMFIWLFIVVVFDIFRSHDIGGVAKAIWVILLLVLPFIGVLIYLIARGGKMQQRRVAEVKQQDQAMRAYVQEAAASSSGADELTKLADLRAKGVITDAEFETQKAKILG
jgi:hypothetical protein